jgi:hypothetical protein
MSDVFLKESGRVIRHSVLKQIPKPAYPYSRFWYREGSETAIFDIRDLPDRYIGEFRRAVAEGDLEAHKAVLRMAIRDQYPFV